MDIKIKNIPTLSPEQILGNGLNLVYFVAGLVAVLAIIIAGFSYVMSRGDTGRIEKAKMTIIYSVVGIIVISVAFTITNFVIGRL